MKELDACDAPVVSRDTAVALSANALRVLEKRYLAKDETGRVVETPDELFRRVARNLAEADRLYDPAADLDRVEAEFYHVMRGLLFMPNSPTLMNAGRDLQQLAACFVLPVGDSMEEIFETVKHAAIIHKCLVADTLVMSNGLTRLSEVRDGAQVMTDQGPFHVSALHDNGEQPVFEVRTNRGYRIVGTAEHRLLVVAADGSYGWRAIGEIQEGDWLVMKPGSWVGGETRLPEFTFSQRPGRNQTSFKANEYRLPLELTPELAELIGLYIGDGSNHRDGIRFTVGGGSPDVVLRIEELSRMLFGKTPTVSKYSGADAFEVAILSVQIKQWFAFLGITKVSSREARIPEIILQGPEEVACAFVRGLFTADGCVRTNGHLTLTTSSPQLGEELQIMLLALGCPTRLRKDISATGYESWQVSVCTKAGFRTFQEKIGFLSDRKAARLAAVSETEIFVKGETIPNQRGRLQAWYHALPQGARHEARRDLGDILGRVSAPRELSRQRLTAVMERGVLIPPFFEELAAEEFFFVRATTIRYAGIRRVYDLTVPDKHAYLANGFVSHNSGGGTGFSFSRLRPAADVVRSTGGVASGPVSFMKVFNHATEAVKQGGTRRGANMGILRVDHPDILDFITCKANTSEVTNFNISVAVTDAFMEAVERDTTYALINPRNGRPVREVRAREVLDTIAQNAWQTGEPGLFFIDAANRANPTPHVSAFEATNPCGEQPLLPYESCNLGSVNLERHLTRPNGHWEVDWPKLEQTIRTCAHFLDNVIDMNRYPVPEIERITKANRKIGLGVMGFARVLLRLGIPYDSTEGVEMGRRIMRFIRDKGYEASARLAETRGAYPNWPGSLHERKGLRLRNSYVTTVAPTGTISMITDTSGGCEPEFSLVWYKNVMDGEHLPYVLEDFFAVAKREGFWSDGLADRIVKNHGSCRGLPEVPARWQRIFSTSHDIAPEWHVRMQAAFQEATDSAVSKTINLPVGATVEDVKTAYLQAYRLGCKGITVYRDASRPDQVMNLGVSEKAVADGTPPASKAPDVGTPQAPKAAAVTNGGNGSNGHAASTPAPEPSTREGVVAAGRKPDPRPEILAGTTVRIQTAHGALYLTVNQNGQGDPFEVFCSLGKAGGCEHSYIEAIGRLISLALRCGVDPEAIVRQLYGIRCGHQHGMGKAAILSGADAIAKGMERYIKMKGVPLSVKGAQPPLVFAHPCPDCGCELDLSENCEKCHFCGFSRCD